MEEQSCLAPSIHRMLPSFSLHGDDAGEGTVTALLLAIEAIADELVCLMLTVHVACLHADDTLVCTLHLLCRVLQQLEFLTWVYF